MISLLFICVFRLLRPSKPPKKYYQFNPPSPQPHPKPPARGPASVACVLRSSRRCCRKARAKRNSELSTPATYGGIQRVIVGTGVHRTMEKRTKKRLQFLLEGGVVGCCGRFFVWGVRDFWGGDVYCWLIDWQLPAAIGILIAQYLISHYDTDGEIAHCGNVTQTKHYH